MPLSASRLLFGAVGSAATLSIASRMSSALAGCIRARAFAASRPITISTSHVRITRTPQQADRTPAMRVGALLVAVLSALAHHAGAHPARRDPAHAKPLAEPAARYAARDVAPDADDPALRGARL